MREGWCFKTNKEATWNVKDEILLSLIYLIKVANKTAWSINTGMIILPMNILWLIWLPSGLKNY